jgi:hypothetical protein
MLSVRCKCCNKELTSAAKPQICGCPNQTTITQDKITAVDMTQVLLLNYEKNVKDTSILSKSDLEYQENRRKRQVRKLDFEIR